MTTRSRQVGALLVFLTLVRADSTHAQLRSPADIKHLALESSPGAERQTEALRRHDRLNPGLLVPTLGSVPTEDHRYFARCVVRANLPKPMSVGLECYDAAGVYFGTKRGANVDVLAYEVWSAIRSGTPLSHSLHSYRYIYVEPFFDRYDSGEFLVNLLRQSSVFTVIYQHEALAMAQPERDLILRCSLDNRVIHSRPSVVGKSVSQLLVFNMDNEQVGAFSGEAKWTIATSEAQNQRKMLENAVQMVIHARREDELIYGRTQNK